MSKLISILKKLPFDVGQAEKKHETAGKRIAFSFVPLVRRSLGEGGNGTGKTAADVGCRDGYWSERLKERGYVVQSLDIEPHYPGALKHDIENGLPFSHKSVDLLWCTEVVEHLRRPEFLFQEIERVMRPRGVAVLTTPNSHWWFYGVVKLWGWTPQNLQNPDHKQFFSEASLRNIARGFTPYGYFPYALFFLKIRRFIGVLSPTFVLVRKF